MHPVRFAFAAAALALAAPLAPAPARAEPPPADFNAFSTFFRKEMESEKPEARLRIVRRAAEILDPRTAELLFDAEAKESARRAAVEKQRVETEAALETVMGEIEKLQGQSPSGPKEVEAFNKKAKKIEAKRDDATVKLRDLAVDAVQGDAVLSSIVGSLGALLDRLPQPTTEGAVALALERWANPKMPVERRVRYVDLLATITKFPTGERLRTIVRDAAEDQRLRTVAFSARVARGDEGALEDALELLKNPPGPLLAAVVDGLRRLHRVECIEPLISFLGREDLGRLRTDAQRALASLTGEKHGPYQQPWADWWKDAKSKFVMPPKPMDAADLTKPDKGVTFYGVTTFSDKILFVLDVSGSMKDVAHSDAYGVRGEERKIDVARRELVSALAMLDEKKAFNIVFFGHRIVRLQGGMVPADRATIDRAKRFVNEFEPSGGTNIHDALETAFQMAGSNVDGKNYLSSIDTIFFLTDGTPTAGKLVKPDEILAAVRGWNRLTQITIHCVAVGDECDAKFLETLARESGGTYVHR